MLPALAVATTVTVWAIAFPAIKLALTEMHPLPLASVRYAMATCFAIVWLLWKRPALIPIADLMTCIACGILGAAGYSVLLNLGQVTVSAGAASFLIKTESIWMAILAVVMLKEALTLGLGRNPDLLCRNRPDRKRPARRHRPGRRRRICSGRRHLFGVGFVLQRKLVQRYGALHVASIMLISAAVTLSPWLTTAISEMRNASAETVSWVVFLGVFPTAVGQICWSYALGHFGAARAGNFLYLVAPLAMLLAWLIYGEAVSLSTIAGGMLVLGGVILVNTRGRNKKL